MKNIQISFLYKIAQLSNEMKVEATRPLIWTPNRQFKSSVPHALAFGLL